MKFLSADCWHHRFMVLVLFCSIFLFQRSGWAGASADEIKQWLDAHNQFRAQHQVGPVTWSDTVASGTQNFIDTCPSYHDPDNKDYSENLGMSRGYIPSISNMVTGWYNEEKDYDYSYPAQQTGVIGHFTQVVWKSTTEIGCAWRTDCPGYWTTVWMCQYNPRGNNGNDSENVFPKKAPGLSPPKNLKVVSADS